MTFSARASKRASPMMGAERTPNTPPLHRHKQKQARTGIRAMTQPRKAKRDQRTTSSASNCSLLLLALIPMSLYRYMYIWSRRVRRPVSWGRQQWSAHAWGINLSPVRFGLVEGLPFLSSTVSSAKYQLAEKPPAPSWA